MLDIPHAIWNNPAKKRGGDRMRKSCLAAVLCFLFVLVQALCAATGECADLFPKKAPPLQAFNVDSASVSVSGISSGAFMAVQLGVAYSSVFPAGFGAFAGGPYDCARDQAFTACMQNSTPDIAKPRANIARWSGSEIDPVKNLADRKIFMWVGEKDTVAGPNVMKALDLQLSQWYSADKVKLIVLPGAGHTFPTDFDSPGNSPCGRSARPFVSNCGYDGAGEALKWLYGKLNGRAKKPLSRVSSFDQAKFISTGKGMDATGYLYVPAGCTAGRPCRLHVALHGCSQGHAHIGMKFVEDSGYNRWADTNDLIILYPQARPDYMLRAAWSGLLNNPAGCWDWIGWYGDDADRHGGAQVEAIVGMVRQVTSGFKR